MSLSKTLNQSVPSYQPVGLFPWFDFSGTAIKILEELDIQVDGGRPWDIQVNNGAFFKRVLTQHSMGLGESYMEGWWDCQALDQLFAKISRPQMEHKIKLPLYLSPLLVKSLFLNLQNKARALNNIKHHYDLGNDFYKAMLDKRMVYSCAYWKNAKTLDEAQEAKLELTCQKLQLKPGMKVLDIGCGWGGFAKYAAEQYGVKVVGVTLSKQQHELATQVCSGLPVEIRLQDYRDIKEKFDRVVSIGMFEHVGKKNYRTYMQAVRDCLADGGIFVLQSIASNISTLFYDPWLEKYIFPGASLPSIKQIGRASEGLLMMEEWSNTGPDYDRTLMSWYENFNRNWPQHSSQYDERFYRMWKYFLLSCAGLFRSRRQQLWRIVFSK